MCSSRGLCGSQDRPPNRSSSSGEGGSGAHYALCALGVGLIALGIVMIVWTVMPLDGAASDNSTATGNDPNPIVPGIDEEEDSTDGFKSSSVALVLVGVGTAILFLSICLGVRNKRKARERSRQPVATGVPYMDHVAGEQEET